FFQAEDGIRDRTVTGVQTCALPIYLGKLRMSQLISCGNDITGEEKANIYEVTLDVGTAIAPAGDGKTHVLTMVTANARPMSTSGDPLRCVTTGQLERRIANALVVKSATP